MFEAIKRMFARTQENKMYVSKSEVEDLWYIRNEDGTTYAGPYKREKDAKGQLTRLRTTYTPASRRQPKEA